MPSAIPAAGTIPWRLRDGRLEVALVHRPRYGDWSWPKGKVDPGEEWPVAAVRETREETGLTAHLGIPLPDATYTSWARLKTALPRALRGAGSRPAAPPIVPPDALYAGRSLAQKLGLSAGERVAVVGAPPGFASLLGVLPAGTRLSADTAAAQRFVWFVKSSRELQLALGTLAALVTTQVAWLAWPKKTSDLKTDLDGNVVREAGLAAGLVDFKVCSIDPTWSGLAFKRRR